MVTSKRRKTLKLNFTVPEDVVKALKSRVGKRQRSAFVTEAVREKLQEMERAVLVREMREGYQARCDENAALDKEWEAGTLENWQ